MKLKAAPFITLIAILALSGCNKAPAPAPGTGPAATVLLKDGGSFSGTVTKSDTSSITLQAASGESRTYPMTQVSSVQYSSDQSGTPPQTAMSSPPPPPTQQQQPPAYVPQREPARAPEPAHSPEPARAAEPVRPTAEVRTIPSGTSISVRNNEPINSDTADPGQTYSAVVARDVVDTEGRIAIPKGSNATLVVRAASGQGKIQGRSELALDVASVSVNGRTYRLETVDLVERGKEGVGTNKRTGVFAGGGAALGGIIGAIAGGGKGAAIGALSGAGAGTATQALTRGKSVRVPSETILDFRLEAPIHIREMR